MREHFNAEKINDTIQFACEGLEDVAASHVAMKAELHLYDGIKTTEVQAALVQAANDLTDEYNPNYNIVAGRLLIYDIRKRVYGDFEPRELYEVIEENIVLGKYDSEILDLFTKDEIDELDGYLDHDKDLDYSYPAALTWEKKYLMRSRVSNEIYESPQIANMLISMCLFSVEGVQDRMRKIKDFYSLLSNQKISLPTPIMSGVRSPTKQFSSCTLIDSDDSLDSINAAGNAIVKYASKRAGIGINGGRLRALGSPIRNGEASHTGVTNFYKKWQADLHSCSQGGLRTSAATLFYPWWHLEIESMLVLKNNKGTDENRVRHMDYALQANKFFYERVMKKEKIFLFSPADVPGLYTSFFTDQDEFARLYEKYSMDSSIRKKELNAMDLMILFANERASTGRIYLMNVDHANENSPFDSTVAPIYMGNLCLEILLPTKPLTNINDELGEIALCTLAAYNLGNIELDEFGYVSELLVEAVDNLLDYQDYPVKAAEKNKLRRTLGIGVINYAYWLAKNGAKYSDGSGNDITHELFERMQYSLLRASNKLAKEKGKCAWFHETSYANGILPIDRYKRDVDNLTNAPLNCDWEALREDIKVYGLRNSTLSALMPAETSALISSATNGIEPARAAMTIKSSKDGSTKNIVPDYMNLKDTYEFVWDMGNNTGYLGLVAIMQKFVDQTISANTNYDPRRYPNQKVSMGDIMKDIFFAYRHGVKTLYYHNTRDGSGESMDDDDCAGGGCKI